MINLLVLDKGAIKKDSFLFLHENISCGYSLEVPWQEASIEYFIPL